MNGSCGRLVQYGQRRSAVKHAEVVLRLNLAALLGLELRGLVLAIAGINVWNRLNVVTRQVAGVSWD